MKRMSGMVRLCKQKVGEGSRGTTRRDTSPGQAREPRPALYSHRGCFGRNLVCPAADVTKPTS